MQLPPWPGGQVQSDPLFRRYISHRAACLRYGKQPDSWAEWLEKLGRFNAALTQFGHDGHTNKGERS